MKALIEISGTGGELVVCPISAEAHDYWSNKSEENFASDVWADCVQCCVLFLQYKVSLQFDMC